MFVIMYVRMPKVTNKTPPGVRRKNENKVILLVFVYTCSAQNTSLNGLSVDHTFALNNDLILKKVVYR